MINIISLTDAGLLLAQRLQALMSEGDTPEKIAVLHQPKPFKEVVQSAFNDGNRLIFICATGIVMRTLAPVIESKMTDPAVIVLDEKGQYVIPLLSGHEGGANQLADSIATLLSANLVSTTAKSYLKPVYTAGMGCERHCPEESLFALLDEHVTRLGLSLDQIEAIASIDIKADEVGLIALANTLKIPFICYSAKQLSGVHDQLQNPSQYVFNTVGVYGVAESAALVSAQQLSALKGSEQAVHTRVNLSELLMAKQKSKVATLAIGRCYKE